MATVRVKRGTRAQISAAASAGGLKQGEIYHVTDEDRVELGLSVGASTAMAKKSEVDGKEAAIAAGTSAQFWRGDKSWRDFATNVRAAVLTGLSTATSAAITATDTVLAALGKLQAQLNNAVFLTGNQTVGGNKSFTSSVLLTGAGALGYGTGAGGTATQPTDKNTAVTINKPSGLITMAAGAIPANSAVAFQVVNSTVAVGDTVSVNLIGGLTTGGSGYVLDAQAPATGSFYIVVRNTTGTAMPSGDQPQLQFNVHKGARS